MGANLIVRSTVELPPEITMAKRFDIGPSRLSPRSVNVSVARQEFGVRGRNPARETAA